MKIVEILPFTQCVNLIVFFIFYLNWQKTYVHTKLNERIGRWKFHTWIGNGIFEARENKFTKTKKGMQTN